MSGCGAARRGSSSTGPGSSSSPSALTSAIGPSTARWGPLSAGRRRGRSRRGSSPRMTRRPTTSRARWAGMASTTACHGGTRHRLPGRPAAPHADRHTNGARQGACGRVQERHPEDDLLQGFLRPGRGGGTAGGDPRVHQACLPVPAPGRQRAGPIARARRVSPHAPGRGRAGEARDAADVSRHRGSDQGTSDRPDSFRQLIYFGATSDGGIYHPRESVDDTHRRWRLYQARGHRQYHGDS